MYNQIFLFPDNFSGQSVFNEIMSTKNSSSTIHFGDDNTHIRVPGYQDSGPNKATGTMYRYKNTTNRFPSKMGTDGNMQLLPNTMDFTLFSRDFKEEDQLVQINFTHEWNKSMTSNCVFWNTTLLKWRTEGCWTTPYENGTTCDCNHLTSFGILFGGSQAAFRYQEPETFLYFSRPLDNFVLMGKNKIWIP